MDGGMSLLQIGLHFALLSLMAVGGGLVILAPEIHHFVVDLHHLITGEQFAAAYTLAQAAPGPNLLFVTLIGWQIAGWFGALVTTVAIIVPPSILTLVFIKVSARHGDSRAGRAFRNGLAPLSVGLLFAGAWVIGSASGLNWHGVALALLTMGLMMRTKINPEILIAAGAIIGILGLV